MRKATLEDIKMELWLRERGDREIRWVTKDGQEIPLRDVGIDHLRNIKKLLERNEEYDSLTYEAKLDAIDAVRDW